MNELDSCEAVCRIALATPYLLKHHNIHLIKFSFLPPVRNTSRHLDRHKQTNGKLSSRQNYLASKAYHTIRSAVKQGALKIYSIQ